MLAASRKGLKGPMHWESGGFTLIVDIILLVWKTQKTFRKGGAAANTRYTKTPGGYGKEVLLGNQQTRLLLYDEGEDSNLPQLAFCVLDISPPSVKQNTRSYPLKADLCHCSILRCGKL